jgi:hypothetical protein
METLLPRAAGVVSDPRPRREGPSDPANLPYMWVFPGR